MTAGSPSAWLRQRRVPVWWLLFAGFFTGVLALPVLVFIGRVVASNVVQIAAVLATAEANVTCEGFVCPGVPFTRQAAFPLLVALGAFAPLAIVLWAVDRRRST